jgi:hypothetical protein
VLPVPAFATVPSNLLETTVSPEVDAPKATTALCQETPKAAQLSKLHDDVAGAFRHITHQSNNPISMRPPIAAGAIHQPVIFDSFSIIIPRLPVPKILKVLTRSLLRTRNDLMSVVRGNDISRTGVCHRSPQLVGHDRIVCACGSKRNDVARWSVETIAGYEVPGRGPGDLNGQT